MISNWSAVSMSASNNKVNFGMEFNSVPAPLGIPTYGRCVGFNEVTHMVTIGEDCSVMFSYDGQSLRENTTSRMICLNDLISGTGAILTSTCDYALDYAYSARGGAQVCVTSSPSLCLGVAGYSTGDRIEFVSTSNVLFTYIYRGTSSNLSICAEGKVTILPITNYHRCTGGYI